MKRHQPRNNKWKLARQIFFFTLTTILIAVLGYFSIVGLYRVFSSGVSKPEDWNLFDGFVSAISLSLLVGGLTYTIVDRIRAEYAEEREKAKLSYAIYQAIFEKLTAPEQEAARRWILANITIKKDDENIESWYQQTHAKIMEGAKETEGGLPQGQMFLKQTLNCFDYIGFIASNYWDIQEDSLDWLSPPIAKVWRRIGPYVAHVRTLRAAKDYYVPAEYIGNLCIKWRRDRGLPDEEYVEKTP